VLNDYRPPVAVPGKRRWRTFGWLCLVSRSCISAIWVPCGAHRSGLWAGLRRAWIAGPEPS